MASWKKILHSGSAAGDFPTLNQATTANAATAPLATTVTVTDNESTNEENAVLFSAGADVDGGSLGIEQDHSGMTYNPSSATLTATTFSGALSGNATTSTNTSGNAATVTTNANLTGDITSSGNATSIASGVIIDADVKSDAAIAMSKTALVGGT